MLSPQSVTQEIGFAVAIGIILSAFVMSAFLVPSLTALLGHAAWWPGHGDAVRRGKDTQELAPDAPEPARRY